jgi:hypothetical protein
MDPHPGFVRKAPKAGTNPPEITRPERTLRTFKASRRFDMLLLTVVVVVVVVVITHNRNNS